MAPVNTARVAPAAGAVIAAEALRLLGDRLTPQQAEALGTAAVTALERDGWKIGVPRPRTRGRLRPYDLPILAGLARGHSTRQIATATGTPHDILRHRIQRIRRQARARSITHMIALAYRNGWLGGLPPEPRPPTPLGNEQLRLLHMLADGLTNPQIGRALGITRDTAAHRIGALYRAMGAHGSGHGQTRRPHAVALGHQHGHLTTTPRNSTP
jgi:DNA-binding NarL/FixJ family response regulator